MQAARAEESGGKLGARLQAGDHAVERIGVDGVRAALLLAQAQDGGHEEHRLRDHAVRRAALQLAQPQQQLRQRTCVHAPEDTHTRSAPVRRPLEQKLVDGVNVTSSRGAGTREFCVLPSSSLQPSALRERQAEEHCSMNAGSEQPSIRHRP